MDRLLSKPSEKLRSGVVYYNKDIRVKHEEYE